MSELKHTPGPWWVGEKKSGYVAQIQIQPAIAISWGAIDEEEADANARLIAAAPDLLEALEHLVSIVDIHQDATNNSFAWAELISAYQAIAKAKGESE